MLKICSQFLGIKHEDPTLISKTLNSLGHRRCWDISSKERLLALAYLNIKSNWWSRIRMHRFTNDTRRDCRSVMFADLESFLGSSYDDYDIGLTRDSTGSIHCDATGSSEFNSDRILREYGEIKFKLNYLNNLDKSRIKLMHKIIFEMCKQDSPPSTIGKSVRSVLALAALIPSETTNNRDDTAIEKAREQIEALKMLSSECAASANNESAFLKWILSAFKGRRDTTVAVQSDVRNTRHRHESVQTTSDAEKITADPFLTIQEELAALQKSNIMGELDECMHYYLNSSRGLKTSSVHRIVSELNGKHADLKNKYVRSSEQSASSHFTMLGKVKRCDISHRRIQQHLNVQYASTGTALCEIRRRNKLIMEQMVDAGIQKSPFLMKTIPHRFAASTL